MNITRVNITSHYLTWSPPPTSENYVVEFFIVFILTLLVLIINLFVRRERNVETLLRRGQTV